MTEQNQEGDADAIVRVVSAVLDLLDTFNRASEVIIPETDSEKAIEAAYKSAYQDIISQFEKL
jgi:molecular chaperone GrpE (heat shock protein)